MGYYYTTDPENAVPPKSWVPPKTHGPGSRVKERGHRFYIPEIGRWASRDPIEEDGGLLLYAFVSNGSINQIDPDGQEAWSRSVIPHGSPDASIDDGVLGYNFQLKVAAPPRSSWPVGAMQMWQMNVAENVFDYYETTAFSYGGPAFVYSGIQTFDYLIDVEDLSRYTSFPDYSGFNPITGLQTSVSGWKNKKVCRLTRTVTKTVGFSAKNETVTDRPSTRMPTKPEIRKIIGRIRNANTWTYNYVYEDWDDCACWNYLSNYGSRKRRGYVDRVYESIETPGYYNNGHKRPPL